MRDRIWLSFDLEFGKDYQGMYAWLAAQGARECGPNLATLFYSYREELVDELKAEITQALKLAEGDRVYLIYKDPFDGETTGIFLVGARGTSPEPGLRPQHPITPLH